MIEFDYWHWFVVGVFLLIAEIITPTTFFVWIAVSAFITGILSFAFPAISFEFLGVFFAILSVLCAYLGKRFVKSREKPTNHPSLNRKEEQMIGKIFVVSKAVENGIGKAKVGDSEWRIECQEDLEIGTKVVVEGLDGATLIVKPENLK
ncbi:MAG: NfeD family protein [Alphaproteobacteria bacterium]